MTREQTQEMLPAIVAFTEGRDVECRGRGCGRPWEVTPNPAWHSAYEYRAVRPPKMRPLRASDIVLGRTVFRSRDDDTCSVATEVGTGGVALGRRWYHFKTLNDAWTMEDGSPALAVDEDDQ